MKLLVGSGTFDRIIIEQDVYPSSTYSITFYHKDGGRQTPTHVDGGSTVLQVQSMQTDFRSDKSPKPRQVGRSRLLHLLPMLILTV